MDILPIVTTATLINTVIVATLAIAVMAWAFYYLGRR